MLLRHNLLKDVPHGFLTRLGGVSDGVYKSLNIDPFSQDNARHVHQNRHIVQEAMAAEAFCTLRQRHSSSIVTLRKPWGIESTPQGDGIVTKQKNVLIGILTADCVPLLLVDKKAGVIGCAHVGWRGLRAGILENIVKAMENIGAERDSVRSTLGPGIQRENYRVKRDMYELFCKDRLENAAYFFPSDNEYTFDLYACIKAALQTLHVARIGSMDMDTYADEEMFYSFRRTQHRKEKYCGRQGSIIMLPHVR